MSEVLPTRTGEELSANHLYDKTDSTASSNVSLARLINCTLMRPGYRAFRCPEEVTREPRRNAYFGHCLDSAKPLLSTGT